MRRARARACAEALAVLRKLWSGEPAAHDGRFFKFEDVTDAAAAPPGRRPADLVRRPL